MPGLFDVIAAATSRSPYPLYAEVARERPFAWDQTHQLWVAAGADAVEEVLSSDLCRVRPAAERVPAALAGTAAGDLFGRLVRMTDGPPHAPLKRAVSATLATVDRRHAAELATSWADRLWTCHHGAAPVERITVLQTGLSAHVIGELLGMPPDRLPELSSDVADLARCIAPGSSPAQVERGVDAARRLTAMMTPLSGGLLTALRRELRREAVVDDATAVANAVGLLTQAHDATAGLIGNAILALAVGVDRDAGVTADADDLGSLVRQVLRRDPPVHSTRRFVARDGVISGQHVRAGDSILVLLAAANHDPSTGPGPRADRHCAYALGAGAHECPGGEIALVIAEAGVRRVLTSGEDLTTLANGVGYRPSLNARVPDFEAVPAGEQAR